MVLRTLKPRQRHLYGRQQPGKQSAKAFERFRETKTEQNISVLAQDSRQETEHPDGGTGHSQWIRYRIIAIDAGVTVFYVTIVSGQRSHDVMDRCSDHTVDR